MKTMKIKTNFTPKHDVSKEKFNDPYKSSFYRTNLCINIFVRCFCFFFSVLFFLLILLVFSDGGGLQKTESRLIFLS